MNVFTCRPSAVSAALSAARVAAARVAVRNTATYMSLGPFEDKSQKHTKTALPGITTSYALQATKRMNNHELRTTTSTYNHELRTRVSNLC